MDSASRTDTHIKIWHKDFWKLNAVAFFLTLSVYMPLPEIAQAMADSGDFTPAAKSAALGIHGVGMFVLGAVCSYLIQRYRRNKVCILAVLAAVACMLAGAYARDNMLGELEARHLVPTAVAALRFLVGVFYGLACQILHSTLVVDSCASLNRTLANMASAWAHRLALVLAPVLSLSLKEEIGTSNVMYLSAALCVVAVGLLSSVSFPFKAPEETYHVFSFDRFLMKRALCVSLTHFSVAAIFGFLVADNRGIVAYAMLAAGFAAVLVLHVCKDFSTSLFHLVPGIAMLVMALAGIMKYAAANIEPVSLAGTFLFGAGVAVCFVCFQRILIDFSDHCQRGTAQSTYILTLELGFAAGLALGAQPQFSDLFTRFAATVTATLAVTVAYVFYVSKRLVD